jgi:predicted nucleotidyltransferase
MRMSTIVRDASPLLRHACEAALRLLPDAAAVYVFGSFAEGRQRGDSDLDLAVLSEQPLDPLRRLTVQRELGAVLDRDVDLIDLHRASTVLRQEVVTRGRALFKRDALFALDFEARTLGDYADLMDATHALRASVRERARVRAR